MALVPAFILNGKTIDDEIKTKTKSKQNILMWW
jgi:hypothetical protein